MSTAMRTGLRRLGRSAYWVAAGCGWLALALFTVWALAALWLDVQPSWLHWPLTATYAVGLVAVAVMVRRRALAAALCAAGALIVLGWWLTLQPSNDRYWQNDVAILPYADIEPQRVTVHNIRNCEYRSEMDFDVRHYDKTFDLDKLHAVDLFLVYWGSPHIAHTMFSFGFDGGDQLCISIETRKEIGEEYSALRGLFRQYELMYVVGDERDLVRLRTNYRQGEDVYLYRLRATPENRREFLLSYLRYVNSLRECPEWYNAVSTNCTTAVRAQRAVVDRAPWDFRMLVNGHLDELLYERGIITTDLPFPELRERSHINARARAAGESPQFSKLIREQLPGLSP